MAGVRQLCSHWHTRWNLKETHDDRACGSGKVCFEMTMLLLMSTKRFNILSCFNTIQPTKPFSYLSNSFMPRLELRGVHKTFGTIYEGPRTRVDQPKIKYWKLHELCKNAIKNIHTVWACGQKFLNVQQLLKYILWYIAFIEKWWKNAEKRLISHFTLWLCYECIPTRYVQIWIV